MKINVKIKPNSRRESIEQTGAGEFVVRVNAPPVEGRANEALIELLSRHFDVPKRNVAILKGRSSKTKLVEILQ